MPTAPSPTQLPRSYSPAEHEAVVSERWRAADVFHATATSDANAYCILIPPPNVTAALHLGHALNNSLQDVLVRMHRMRGFNTMWMPGTDHAGIATQSVVEKRLVAEGSSRRELGREAFVERVQAWKDEYETTITEQLQAMGASCDWSRQRFTMDDVCARAVRHAFFTLFRDELIYRGKRLVNWDPVSLTALADDEVEMREVEGSFWYLKYPIVDDAGRDSGEFVTVATTRPETMLGDTAVGVNPGDAERAHLVGRRVRLPIVDRIIPIIADDYVVVPDASSDDVKARYASGFLKVTPAHDPNDWLIGVRHELPVINVMAPDGSISDRHGWEDATDEARALVGLTREDARKAVVEWFRARDLLAETRPYQHSVGHSYRSHVPVEPYLSDQWYVRVTDDRLVGAAQRGLVDEQFEGDRPGGPRAEGDGELTFFPARYARTYQAWHAGLRDWCISRQLWWGHRIPVWSYALGEDVSEDARRRAESLAASLEGDDAAVSATETGIHVCLREDDAAIIGALESAGFVRDPDVLDTWFSSGLWPMSTLGWPEPEGAVEDGAALLEAFNPSSVLCTAREIITLWVSRMVMFNRYFRAGRLPFRHVYIHPLIQDGHGQKMSKSLGNGVDPRGIIRSHGADALRFTLVSMATSTQDVRLPVDAMCPICGTSFNPTETTSPAGYRVSEPHISCPKCDRRLVSAYGMASSLATPTEDEPLALNTSSKFDLGRNFANKVWNATRFALGTLTLEGGSPDQRLDDLPVIDRWIINRLHDTLHAVEDAVSVYQFNTYADAMYDFIWRELCDWYLEAIKPTIREHAGQQQVLRTILNASMRLLHPICPFVTEALWPHVQGAGPAGVDGITLPPSDLLATAPWPDIACRVHDDAGQRSFDRARELVNAIRSLRAQHKVSPKKRIVLSVPPVTEALIAETGGLVETLCLLDRVEVGAARAPDAIPLAFEGEEVHVSGLVDAVDVGTERARLAKLVAEKSQAVQGYRAKLSNRGYVDNAPPAVVEETRQRAADAEADLAAAERALAALGPG